MTTQSRIEDLVKEKLFGRKIDGVGFVDELLQLVQAVGEIHCTPIDGTRLRFLIFAQPPAFEIEVDAAVSKLRMLCARLAVLCNENGGQDVSLYGGEGVIQRTSPNRPTNAVLISQASVHAPSQAAASVAEACPSRLIEWWVRFKNTPSEQEFSIRIH